MRESVVKEIQPIAKALISNPSKDLVVTLSKEGRPLSVFSDDTWDCSATSNTLKTLNFRSKIQKLSPVSKVKDDDFNLAVRFLKVFSLNWICEVNGCSMSKLNSDLDALSFLVSYCLNSNIALNKIFTDPKAIDFVIENNSSEKQIGLRLGKIQRVVDTTLSLINNGFWSELSPSASFMKKLIKTRKTFPETTPSIQTLIIPSSIYQALLKDAIEDLSLFVEYIHEIEYVFSARSKVRDEVLNNTLNIDETTSSRKLTQSEKLSITYKWNQFVKSDVDTTLILGALASLGLIQEANWGGLVKSLAYIQIKSAIIIAAFTGMRKNEILAIPFNGLSYIHTNEGNLPVIWSTTTKLESNGVPRFTKWATGSIVENAFKASKFITKGVLCWSDSRSKTELDESKLPLFISIEQGKSGKQHPYFEYTTPTFGGHLFKEILIKQELLVSEQDIAELSWFLYGDQISDKVKLGQPWPLAFHQFRRSLAVYAASSGYVSYPTLKSQLKHISMVMTVYYSNSNSRAINILGDGAEVKAMKKEWQDAQSRTESDDLYKVLKREVILTGAAGKGLQSKKSDNKLPKFLGSRKETKKAIKNGKIRYRSTLVGGCMSITPCDKGAGILASACISCENAVFLPESQSSLLQTKEFYESQISLEIPKRVRHEYETSIKKIDSFLSVLISNT